MSDYPGVPELERRVFIIPDGSNLFDPFQKFHYDELTSRIQ